MAKKAKKKKKVMEQWLVEPGFLFLDKMQFPTTKNEIVEVFVLPNPQDIMYYVLDNRRVLIYTNNHKKTSLLVDVHTLPYIGVKVHEFDYESLRIYKQTEDTGVYTLEECLIASRECPSAYHEQNQIIEKYGLSQILFNVYADKFLNS